MLRLERDDTELRQASQAYATKLEALGSAAGAGARPAPRLCAIWQKYCRAI